MSAFIVGNEHINALVNYCVANRISFYNPESKERTEICAFNAEEIGRILLDQNVRSVGHRYSGRISSDEKNAAASFKYRRAAKYLCMQPVQVIKACHCLDYQSCETDDSEGTLAHRILQSIISHATHKLVGYEAAAWEIV